MPFAKPNKYLHVTWITQLLIVLSIMLLVSCGREPDSPNPESAAQIVPTTSAKSISELSSEIDTTLPPPIPKDTIAAPIVPATDTATPTATLLPTATTEPIFGPHEYPKGINPLTGLYVEDTTKLERRPLAIKVSHYPRSVRPQSGLAAADMVWEHYAEGGTTRFTAIFYVGEATRVGSIRSARLIDTTLTEMFSGALVASGMSDGTLERLRQKTWYPAVITNSTSFGCPPICRESQSANSVFVDTSAVWQTLDDLQLNMTPKIQGLAFQETIPNGGQNAVRLRVDYSREAHSEWRYNPDDGKYYRWTEISEVDLEPHFDYNTKAQITADNLVVLFANHVVDSTVPEDYAADGIHAAFATEIQLWGGGPALILRNGQAYSVNWVRMDSADMTFLVDADNKSIALHPGKTWFHTTGLGSETADQNGVWTITHKSPYDWGKLILPTE